MSLSLRGNPIETIGTRSFHRLKYLTKLDLSECHISNVDPGAFEGLESLQRIYLHNNHLTTISGRDIPPSLHGLSVHDNRSIYWLPCGSKKLGFSILTLRQDARQWCNFHKTQWMATKIKQLVANLSIFVAHFAILVAHFGVFKAKFVS